MAAGARKSARGGADGERISRAIVGFGRYPNKRPAGLKVDASGAFGLNDLMRVWGKKEGLSQEDILGAVRAHMFHEGDAGALRFALGENEDGSIWIRVLPKRGHQQRACATPSRAQWHWQDKQAGQRPAPPAPTPKLTPGPGPRGSVGLVPRQELDKAEASQPTLQERLTMALDEMIGGHTARKDNADQPLDQGSSPKVGTKEKLEMPLDEVIRSEDVEMTDACSPAKKATSSGSGTASSAAWGKKAGAKAAGGSWDGWNWASSSERWSSQRRGGRRRTGRQAWSWREGGWQRRGDEGEGADAWHGRADSPARSSSSGSRSRSVSWRRARRDPRPHQVAAEEDAASTARPGQAPSRPPGPFWSKYQDDGLVWWHYHGPLGQWFCSSDLEEPTPYNPDP